ncbi:13689_t:CDS:2 [Funneliformis caledonium]|uniref:13689_t:CDS:1 n=1 Tax=Funneliformis caledonium TaxID=1117310 RepID=A0A9N9CWD9_9GLOM|nr:13689_t:CDS:2 [Funneliformis caledonium]
MLLKQLRLDIYCQLPFAGIKQEFQQFIFDVEFLRKSNNSYVRFLNSVLNYYDVIQGLKDKCCFSNSNTRILKKITDLFDPNNLVLLGGNRNTDVFLNSSILEHAESLSSIFGRILRQTLLSHSQHSRVFGCLNEVILSKYRDVAWSKMYLIAEDIILPSQILQKLLSFEKPNVSNIVKNLRFLYNDLHNDDELRNSWADRFKHDIFEIYKWLDDETSHEDIDLSKSNPFNRDNWITAKYLILNREPGEDQYVNPMLARYSNMLKGADVREIKPLIIKYGLSNMINQVLTEKEHLNFY